MRKNPLTSRDEIGDIGSFDDLVELVVQYTIDTSQGKYKEVESEMYGGTAHHIHFFILPNGSGIVVYGGYTHSTCVHEDDFRDLPESKGIEEIEDALKLGWVQATMTPTGLYLIIDESLAAVPLITKFIQALISYGADPKYKVVIEYQDASHRYVGYTPSGSRDEEVTLAQYLQAHGGNVTVKQVLGRSPQGEEGFSAHNPPNRPKRDYYLPIGKPRRRGEEAPLRQHLFFPGEKLKKQRKLKTVTWCEIQSRLADFRKYFQAGQDGLDWYDRTPQVMLDLFGGDVARRDLFILLLASTSPLEDIRSNVRLALKALKLFDAFGVDEKVFRKAFRFEAHRKNILRALRGEPLSGPKVTAFAKNLFGPAYYPDAADAVTVDRWMVRAARGVCIPDVSYDPEDDAPTEPEYRCIERAIRKLAVESNVQPRQYQAAVWVGIKRRCGSPEDTVEPFEVELRRKLQSGQSEFDFDAPVDDLPEDPLAGLEPDYEDPYGVAEEQRVESENPPLRAEISRRVLDDGGGEYILS